MNAPLVIHQPGSPGAEPLTHHKRHGRKSPYTSDGIKKLPCFRCGSPSTQQWKICSDGGFYRPICTGCDTLLNKLVLWFMRDPDWAAKLDKYIGEMK